MEDNQIIVDCDGKEIKVGSKVEYFENNPDNPDANEYGTVIEITDWDGDVDDDTGRSITIPPDVKVQYEDGTIESYTTTQWEFTPTSHDDEGNPMSHDSSGQVEELRVVSNGT